MASKVTMAGILPRGALAPVGTAHQTDVSNMEGGQGAFCQEEVQQVIRGIICDTLPKQESLAQQKPLVKAIRTIRHVVKKWTANASQLFGAGSRSISLVFVLRKRPERSQRKALQIALPYPMFPGRSAEGLFLKAAGVRQLTVQFGWCSMEEECLVKNASAVLEAVKRKVGRSLVREIRVQEMNGLALPVWDMASEKRQQRLQKRRSKLLAAGLMLPPPLPAKRAKVRAFPSLT